MRIRLITRIRYNYKQIINRLYSCNPSVFLCSSVHVTLAPPRAKRLRRRSASVPPPFTPPQRPQPAPAHTPSTPGPYTEDALRLQAAAAFPGASSTSATKLSSFRRALFDPPMMTRGKAASTLELPNDQVAATASTSDELESRAITTPPGSQDEEQMDASPRRQGQRRRPGTPDIVDTLTQISQTLQAVQRASEAQQMSNVENLSPQIIRQVAKELQDLVNKPPEGIKVNINDQDITDIQAFIEGPAGTPYAGGAFKVKLVLGKDFPQGPPKAFFLTKIFHPNVAKNGEICVNTLKKDWKPDLGIKHILLTIKCLLIVPNAESALNEEAGKLLLEHYDDYSQRATMMTEIHAVAPKPPKPGLEATSDGPLAKKHAGDKKVPVDKKKILKDKKRTLKRL